MAGSSRGRSREELAPLVDEESEEGWIDGLGWIEGKQRLVGLVAKSRKGRRRCWLGRWIRVDPDGDLGDKCIGGRDKSLVSRVGSVYI